MKLVIVSGAEATCKTAIGKEIARSLGCKYQSKDNIKEALFDSEFHTTRDYSWYERRAKQQFFKDIQQYIVKDIDAVIESNFIGEDKARLQACLNDNVQITEIYCFAKGMTSFRRFVHRNESKLRHKGHHDRRWYLTVFFQCLQHSLGIQGIHKPIGLSGQLLSVDTTNFSKIDFQSIAEFARSK